MTIIVDRAKLVIPLLNGIFQSLWGWIDRSPIGSELRVLAIFNLPLVANYHYPFLAA